jgi:choline dehydrogenase-like flavoprotein
LSRRRFLGGVSGALVCMATSRGRALERTDAIVIGSGAGGAMVALRLAERGRSVLVLERGPWWRREDFSAAAPHDLRPFRPDPAVHPHTFRRAEREHASRSDAGWTAIGVGGATVVYGGVSMRARPSDLTLLRELGPVAGAALADWPIGYDELSPYYEEAEALLGVNGGVADNPFEPPRRRPMAAAVTPDGAAGPAFDAAARRVGLHPYRTPLAIRGVAGEGRGACDACGHCVRGGCPRGAKSSAAEAIWPRALRSGRVRLVTDALVTQIALDARGRASRVRWYDAGGATREAAADAIVVACGAVETARLLLLSREPRHRDGLGNHSGWLGRGVTYHHVSELGGVLPDVGPTLRAPPSPRALDDAYRLPAASGAPLGGVILLGDALPPIGFAARRGGGGITTLLGYARHARLFSIGQDLPRWQSSITLDAEVRDAHGLPVACITHENHPLDRVAGRALADRAEMVLEAAGATHRWRDLPENTSGDAHQHGSCRFGDDPARSVLDRDCAVHGIPNLFVADGAFMPTALGVPPALTIQANALRVADRLDARGRTAAL